ncbi:F-type H+-transporting ATPase subunit b [Chitinophaga terrae (ex Kim and Jung 2007)]|jgi:F-type H+-transporting ATPase subunit b|uniref:ATP synthase subunit b n=1 Tax=Chitinophaga terrae (ex Kim and Jung 2007) TaxID=408074 RepID=A0A1H3Y4A9_9BACT|nr:F0F1 ATP synthase subunit B [Chitinophaga terrae (ex Kim and Jung 2007)]MDQ0108015.1 F-type H+-transporting ATPase subunit b [Chitinophaga terrae (ex Kim and Jung 2007)]GEP90944.1 ATP synthase subunit b [Chitinophaga terrae (ex Kim and Jung 2007)]SEA06456.1 F-type H+-transporting ATPase subunit b [Chitinophaga terrae (ex Kim and Jung 2007)]
MDLLQPALGLFLISLIIFIIVFLILKKFAWTPILSTLKEREGSIADSIATAERVKEEMAQMKAEHEHVLAEAKAERSKILKEAKEAKDMIISEAKTQAQAEAKKIISEAYAAIENQKMAALTDVKNQVGTLVIEVAEKVLRKELSDKAAQEGYVKQLAEEIKLN